MITVGLVTSARADLSYYLPLMRTLTAHPAFALKIIATGMHLVKEFGMTIREIEAAGFSVFARIPSYAGGDTPADVAASLGQGVVGCSRLFARWRPDLLVVLGDRYDMVPAALAALPFRIPVAHIAGGDLTQGAIDDALRHSLTKLSHLHCVALEAHRQRLLQMGEEPWRVVVCGALTLDELHTTTRWTPEDTASRFGFALGRPTALITFHPVTLESDQTSAHMTQLLTALDRFAHLQCLFTYPNADTAYRTVLAAVQRFCTQRPADRRLVVNAGPVGYFSLMNTVSVLVGNSSSGPIEALSLQLPVVNIGTRQEGRLCPANVISCGYGAGDIAAALTRALRPEFRLSLRDVRNPYGDGHAAERIVEHLERLWHRPALLRKHFVDHEAPAALEVGSG